MKLKDILLEVESEQKVDVAVNAIGQELKKLAAGVEDALEDADDNKQEGLLTTASLLLALPAMLGLVARTGKAVSGIIQKTLGKKPQDQSGAEKYFQQLGGVADELHHLYMKPIELKVRKFIKCFIYFIHIFILLAPILLIVILIANLYHHQRNYNSKQHQFLLNLNCLVKYFYPYSNR
jgi:hypothetical protein